MVNIGVSASISGVKQTDFLENYDRNVQDLTNALFAAVKASGVPVEKVVILSVEWVTVETAREQARRALESITVMVITFSVQTNTAGGQSISSISDSLQTGLADNLLPELQSLPENPLLASVKTLRVDSVTSPTISPTPSPTVTKQPVADPLLGSILAGVMVLIAVGYLAYNTDWETFIATYVYPKRASSYAKSLAASGKVVPADDDTWNDGMDSSVGSVDSLSSLYSAIRGKKVGGLQHVGDTESIGGGSFSSFFSRRSNQKKVFVGGDSDHNLELDSIVSGKSAHRSKRGKKKELEIEAQLEDFNLTEAGENLDLYSVTSSLGAGDSTYYSHDNAAFDQESLSDQDQDSISMSTISTVLTKNQRGRKKERMSREERNKAIKKKQQLERKKRYQQKQLLGSLGPWGDVRVVPGLDQGGDAGESKVEESSCSPRSSPSPLPSRSPSPSLSPSPSPSPRPGLGFGLSPVKSRSSSQSPGAHIVDIITEEPTEAEDALDLLLRAPPSPMSFASPSLKSPIGSILRPLAGRVEEGSFERKAGIKHLSGVRGKPRPYDTNPSEDIELPGRTLVPSSPMLQRAGNTVLGDSQGLH